MIKTLALTALLLAAGNAHAQERTAAGGAETQMTWSALSTQIHATNTKLDALTSRVEQSVLCGKKGKIYAPGVAGADADGCIEASSNGGVTLTNITNSISTLNSNLTTTNTNLTNTSSNVTNIVNCNKNGQIFNGTGCVASPFKPTCTLTSTGPSGAVHTSSNFSNGTCPSGTTSVGTGSSTGALKCLKVACN